MSVGLGLPPLQICQLGLTSTCLSEGQMLQESSSLQNVIGVQNKTTYNDCTQFFLPEAKAEAQW